MVLYPTTVIFRVVKAIQKALVDLKAGSPMPECDSVTFAQYEQMLGLPEWGALENEYEGTHDPLGVPTHPPVAAAE